LLARPRLPAGDRAGCWVPRLRLARLPQLTAHSWLADSAVAAASKPQEVCHLAHPPLPESSCRVRLRRGSKCRVPPLHVNLVCTVYRDTTVQTFDEHRRKKTRRRCPITFMIAEENVSGGRRPNPTAGYTTRIRGIAQLEIDNHLAHLRSAGGRLPGRGPSLGAGMSPLPGGR